MTLVALKGLAWRKIRATLTALAVVLGVAMVSGAFILTDSMKKAADSLAADSYAGVDAVISGKSDFKPENDWNKTPPIAQGVVAKVRRLPQVGAAIGGILDQAKLVGSNGKIIGQPPNFAVGLATLDPAAERLNPLKLKKGRWARGPREVVIDLGTARREHISLGDPVPVVAQGPKRDFRVVGLVGWGDVTSLGTATMAMFDLATAQKLFNKKGEVDSISVASKPGVSGGELRRAIRAALPAAVQVQTAKAADPFDFSGLQSFVRFIKIFLLAFGGVALFVGAFIIFNTFSITVAQRAREFALLRTIGASRRQVLRSVILEALVIGLLATAGGIALGLAIAVGLRTLMRAIDFDLPQAGTVFAARTVIVSLLIGVVVTVVAALIPAVRATRVPPVAILREGASTPRSRLSPVAPYVAALGILLGTGLLVYGMFAGDLATLVRVLALVLGTLMLFVGVALVSPRLVRPLAWAVGWPAAKLGGATGRLARENATRNPGRTAVTAAALMIGIALVTFVSVLARGVRDAFGSTVHKQVSAQFVLTSNTGWDSFSPAAPRALASRPGISRVSDVRVGQARIRELDSTPSVSGVEPRTIGHFYRFRWQSGSAAAVATLGPREAILVDDYAKDHRLRVGSRLVLETHEHAKLPVVVKAIYKPPGIDSLLGDILISAKTFDATFPRPRDAIAFLETTDGVSRAAVERALEPYADVKLQTQREFVDSQSEWIDQMLLFIYVLLGLSVVVSFFGIVNTLVLSTVERTRELGMLRAVGMTRRQVRRMVRHESVITALIGAVLGVVVGIALAALVTRRLSQFSTDSGGEGLSLSIPILSLLAFAVVAAVAGIVAAILPARRASRLNVLEALQYE